MTPLMEEEPKVLVAAKNFMAWRLANDQMESGIEVQIFMKHVISNINQVKELMNQIEWGKVNPQGEMGAIEYMEKITEYKEAVAMIAAIRNYQKNLSPSAASSSQTSHANANANANPGQVAKITSLIGRRTLMLIWPQISPSLEKCPKGIPEEEYKDMLKKWESTFLDEHLDKDLFELIWSQDYKQVLRTRAEERKKRAQEALLKSAINEEEDDVVDGEENPEQEES